MRTKHSASRERPAQERILVVLGASGGATPAAVAKSLGMNPATARSQLRHLAARGAVAKVDGRYSIAVTSTVQATRADEAKLHASRGTDASQPTAKRATTVVVTAPATEPVPAPPSPASATRWPTQPATAHLANSMPPPAGTETPSRGCTQSGHFEVLKNAGYHVDHESPLKSHAACSQGNEKLPLDTTTRVQLAPAKVGTPDRSASILAPQPPPPSTSKAATDTPFAGHSFDPTLAISKNNKPYPYLIRTTDFELFPGDRVDLLDSENPKHEANLRPIEPTEWDVFRTSSINDFLAYVRTMAGSTNQLLLVGSQVDLSPVDESARRR